MSNTEIRYDAAKIRDAEQNYAAKKYDVQSYDEVQKNMNKGEAFVAILYNGQDMSAQVMNVSKQSDYHACINQSQQFEKIQLYKIGAAMLKKCTAKNSKNAAKTYDFN